MGDRRFPQHAHGAAATIAYRASPSPNLCGYFWGEVRRIPLLETVWKIVGSIAVAYAAHYGEQKIPHRLVRQRMGLPWSAPSRTSRARASQDT
jgi:hypothetical protein